MALNLPKFVQSLFVQDSDATRVRDNLTVAVQPLLDFVNTYFVPGADGFLGVTRPATFASSISVAGSAVFAGVQTGALVATGINAPAVTATTVTATSLSGTQVTSAAGFKTVVPCGEYWNSAPNANSQFQFLRTVSNVQNGSLGLMPFVYKWSHPGSVVGLSLYESGPNTALKTVQILRNGSVVYTWNAGSAGNGAAFWTTQPKGAIPFAAGDTLTCYGLVGSTANTQLMLLLTLEMSA